MRRATAILLGTVALVLSACGGDDSKSYGTFTDCATIGKPVTISDPAGDQRRSNGTRDDSAPQGDLVKLRVAKSANRLCAEFTAKEQIKPYVAFVLTMRPQDSDTPVVQLEATVLAGQAPQAMLDASGTGRSFGKVDATVGIDGKRLSIVVGRGPFDDQGAGALFRSFRFQARSAVAVEDAGRVTDCMPVCQ
ncbi:hypothetical protein DSM104299_03283 [Baekduia alba]|uniref:hypothetical protein n=1 Tax=Baekduia alba TaxID=2997333 RepID=UPI0023426AA3|nr:hypothetical protein [Baekduia alba]WCB94546.1 hypothetical protein DSM104299_03283 [Baekduia alba]